MESINDSEFDLVIVGTGLSQSLLALYVHELQCHI